MTSFETRIQSVLVQTVPLPTDAGRDWEDVLARSAAWARPARTRRLAYSVAFAAVAAIVLFATPLGAAIARGFGDFSGWLSGRAGTPVSNSERRTIERLSWELFPKGAKLKRLITLSRDGIDYKLYGYQAGGMFCLRLATSPALLAQTSCAPRSDLISKRKPVLPLYVDAPVVGQKKVGGWMVSVKKSSVTFGIVSDGVTAVRARTRSGKLFGVVASDSFLIINPGAGSRLRSVSASDAGGDVIAIPIAGPPKSSTWDNGALMNKPPSGPAFRMAKQQITGVKIGWLDRREPRGTAVPRSIPEFEPGTTFARLLAPDPDGAVRIAVSLHRNGNICMSIVLPQSEMAGDGEACTVKRVLNWGGWPDVTTADFLWRQAVTITEGDQYVTNAGFVDDHISRMMLLLVSGQRVPVPVKDNTFVYMVPRTEYPVLLLAYNSEGRIVGIERDTGKYNGYVVDVPTKTKIVPRTAPVIRGNRGNLKRSRYFPKVRTIPGGVITESQPDPLVFEQSKLIHEFTQAGMPFYDVIVLLKNRSNKTAVDIRPTLGVRPEGNNGTGGIILDPIATILPHSESLIVYPYFSEFGFSESKKTRIDVEIESVYTRRGARSPVSFSHLRYKRSKSAGAAKCSVTGLVSNSFTKKRTNLQLSVAGFVNGRLFSGGFTTLDTVFPGRDALFEVDLYAATCPKGLDRIGVYPNLSEDEIYNP